VWETVTVILTVLVAAMGVGYGLYRIASGKADYGACKGRDNISCRQSRELADVPSDTESK